MAISKKELTTLVQQLSEQDIPLVVDLLKRLIKNPLDAHIPYDDEPLTEEDIKDIEIARKEFADGKNY